MSGHANPLHQPEHLSLPGIRAERDALLAENQRLRDALEAARPYVEYAGYTLVYSSALEDQVRDALAGDTEPPDPDTSPFDKPRLETVEKGLPGPWNDKTWENDNG